MLRGWTGNVERGTFDARAPRAPAGGEVLDRPQVWSLRGNWQPLWAQRTVLCLETRCLHSQNLISISLFSLCFAACAGVTKVYSGGMACARSASFMSSLVIKPFSGQRITVRATLLVVGDGSLVGYFSP
jgi:hypothetical protein